MEKKLPVIAKRIWGIVRVIYLMLKKGISNKRKAFLDLNLMMKRGKIASKAIRNLMFYHHNASSSSPPRDYEFSCSNTPNNYYYYYPFHLNKRRHHHNHLFTTCSPPPQTLEDDVAILEILKNDVASPMVMRQLRITDSPFPLKNNFNEEEEEEDTDDHVDEAAEKFINKFYKDLRLQQIN